MTEKPDLEALKALIAAATPGPWTHGHVHEDFIAVYGVEDADGGKPVICDVFLHPRRGWMENAALIAAARTALPGLVEEVERLREAVGIYQRLGKMIHPFGEDERSAGYREALSLFETVDEQARAALKGDQA